MRLKSSSLPVFIYPSPGLGRTCGALKPSSLLGLQIWRAYGTQKWGPGRYFPRNHEGRVFSRGVSWMFKQAVKHYFNYRMPISDCSVFGLADAPSVERLAQPANANASIVSVISDSQYFMPLRKRTGEFLSKFFSEQS